MQSIKVSPLLNSFTYAGVTNGNQRTHHQRQRQAQHHRLYPIFRGVINGWHFDLCRVA